MIVSLAAVRVMYIAVFGEDVPPTLPYRDAAVKVVEAKGKDNWEKFALKAEELVQTTKVEGTFKAYPELAKQLLAQEV